MRIIAILAFTMVSTATSIAGEAVTYLGTLGKLPVIVELNGPGNGSEFQGRYAYLSKGGDIPLSGSVKGDGTLAMEEEAPCTPELCQKPDGEAMEVAPKAADWILAFNADKTVLSGQWRNKKGGKALKVELARKSVRTLSPDVTGLDSLDPMSQLPSSAAETLEPASLPYDFLKTSAGLIQGKTVKAGPVEYSMVSDPRTGLAFPTFLKIGDKEVKPVNDWMMQRRVQSSLNSFSCLSKAYLGFYWSGSPADGTNGVFDTINTSVEYASDRLIGVQGSGSFDCGGAHPNHYISRYYADVKTGKPVRLGTLLKGWVAKNYDGQVVEVTDANKDEISFGPNDELVAFVTKNMGKLEDIDPECGIPDLIKSNLGVYFEGDNLVFTLEDLPHVVFACTTDLMSVPLKDARPLLTEAGAKYFSALD